MESSSIGDFPEHGRGRPTHGGLDHREVTALGLDPAAVLDFSASISPLGPPPAALDALAGVNLAAYPDSTCQTLRRAMGERLGIPPQRILVGNGSTELIHLLARAFLQPGDKVAIFSPTFSEYAFAATLAGAKVVPILASEGSGFQWDMDTACRAIRQQRPRIVFLCNPNNPTGVYLSRGPVQAIAGAAGKAFIVIDEAYLSFVEGAWDSLALLADGRFVLLRSMTKDYALAALRLGYALAADAIIRQLGSVQPSWSVNGLAQAAGLAVLSQDDYLQRARLCVQESKAFLTRELATLGLLVVPSAANFLLVDVGNGTGVRSRLLREGVCVRDCTSFGLPRHIRIGVRTLPDCRRLVEALRKVVAYG